MKLNKLKPFPFLKQTGMMECGTTSLAMIFKHYGFHNIKNLLAEWAEVTTEGTDLYTLSELAERFGFKTDGFNLKFEHLMEIKLPCIAHYEGNHFIVIYRVNEKNVWVADPSYGKDRFTKEDFQNKWNGIVLVLEPENIKTKKKDSLGLFNSLKARQSSIFKEFYWKVIKPFKKVIKEIFLASLILQVLALALPFFTQAIVDNVLVNENKKLLFGILAAMLLVFITQILLFYIRNILLLQFKIEFELEFFSNFFSHFISLKQKFYDNHKREDFINRFHEKVKIRSLANPNLLQSVIDLVFIIGYLPILLIYNLSLGVFALIFTIMYLGVTAYFTPILRDQVNKIFYKDIIVLGKFLDTLLGISNIKLLGIERFKFWKWKNEYRRNLNVVLAAEHKKLLLLTIQKGIFFFSQLVIFWYGAFLAFNGLLTIGQYLAFITIFMIIINSLNSVSHLWLSMMDLFVSASRINDILIQEPETSKMNANSMIKSIDVLELKNLSFKYNERDQEYVLDGLNCSIEKGNYIGIVGRNGTGKTTLAKLITYLYPSFDGRILINGRDIGEFNIRSLRKKVFLFPQDIYIFDGSIKENILCANPDASMEEVNEAAKKVGLHEFVKSRYLGYNHKIGEFGSNLSGGQKLKIGFARLFISNPEVIILDEACSSLDLQTEQQIMNHVYRQFANKIIISIAHRVYTLRNANRIYVLDDGKFVEHGTHKELLEYKGLYHQFLNSYINF